MNPCRALLTAFIAHLLFLTPVASQDRPHWQIALDGEPPRAGSSWSHLDAADTRSIVAMGNQPMVVIRSTDAGVSWTEAFRHEDNDSLVLRAIAHPSPNVVILLADSTYNRGLSGIQIRYDYSGLIMRSTDAGTTWVTVRVGPAFRRLPSGSLVMASPSLGYFYQLDSLTTLWKTTDAGASWEPVPVPGHLYNLNLTASGESILLRSAQTIARSSDAGKTWEVIPSTLPRELLTLTAVSPLVAYSTGSRRIEADRFAGRVHRTTDGGTSWQVVLDTLTTSNGFLSSAFGDPLHGWVAGGAGTFRTSDGGVTWHEESLPATGGYATTAGAMVAPSIDTAVAVGHPGVILRHVIARPMSAPDIVEPGSNDTLVASSTPIRWKGVIGATAYRLRIVERDTVTFPPRPSWDPVGRIIVDRTTSDTIASLSDMAMGKEYIVSVKAMGESIASPWSRPATIFTVQRASASTGMDHPRAVKTSTIVRARRLEPRLTLRADAHSRYLVVDVSGRRIASGSADQSGAVTIDMRELATGTYFATIAASRVTTCVRIVVVP